MLRKNGIVLTTLLNFYEINLSKGHNLGYPQFLADRWFETYFIFPYIGNRHPN